METEFVVYVLYSKDFNQIYIGYTSSLLDRFYSHNIYATKGHTKKYRPWKVVHVVEFYKEKSEAIRREKSLKTSRGRDFVRNQFLG
jgi:putative endonuclease